MARPSGCAFAFEFGVRTGVGSLDRVYLRVGRLISLQSPLEGERDKPAVTPPLFRDTVSPIMAEITAGKQRGRPFRRGESGNSAGRPVGARHNRIVTIGQLVLFSTETGDAWLLDPGDRLAARL